MTAFPLLWAQELGVECPLCGVEWPLCGVEWGVECGGGNVLLFGSAVLAYMAQFSRGNSSRSRRWLTEKLALLLPTPTNPLWYAWTLSKWEANCVSGNVAIL